MSRLILIPLVLCLGYGLLFAATPRTLHYQSRLTDDSGVAINDTVALVAVLYGSVAGTDSLWAESHPVTPVLQGLYDLTLGGTTPINLPFDVSYWLEIRVEGTALTPRVPFTAVPYARRAIWADSVLGGTGPHNHWGQTWTGTGLGLRLNSSDSTGLYGTNTGATSAAPALYGSVAGQYGSGVYGINTNTLASPCDSCYGVTGSSTRGVGVRGIGYNHGILGSTSSLTSSGVMGRNSLADAFGRLGAGYYGVHGSTTRGSSSGGYGGIFLGQNAASGIGSVSLGNNVSSFSAPTNGCGAVFVGNTVGAAGNLALYQPRGYLGYYGNFITGLGTYPVGVYAEGRTGVGLVATSQSSDGLRAYTSSTDGVNPYAAVYGYALNSDVEKYGVQGVSEGMAGAGVYGHGMSYSCGVAGNSLDGTGAYPGVLGMNDGGGFGVYSNADMGVTGDLSIVGNFYLTGGTKSAVLRTSKGWEAVYCTEAPDVEFMASGSAQLVNGVCHVDFERLFVEASDPAVPMKITVTPSGPCQTLYISNRDTKGFTIRESFGGTSSVTFDWIAISRRVGYAQRPTNERVTQQMEKMGRVKMPSAVHPLGPRTIPASPETPQQVRPVD